MLKKSSLKRTRIKICGISTPEQALWAVEAGADAIGLMFYDKSSRAVTIDQAVAICAVLPPFVSAVGVFVDPDPSWVHAVIDQVPLALLQFHGFERDSFCDSFQMPFTKAIPMNEHTHLEDSIQAYPHAKAFLLDTASSKGFGGTGQSFDWSVIPKSISRPIILAGGLTPENVAEAILQVDPFAVDVSSGVESAPGVKDPEKIKQFMKEVNCAKSS